MYSIFSATWGRVDIPSPIAIGMFLWVLVFPISIMVGADAIAAFALIYVVLMGYLGFLIYWYKYDGTQYVRRYITGDDAPR